MSPPLLRLSSSGVWVPEHESAVERARDMVSSWIDTQAPPHASEASPAKSTGVLLPGIMLLLSMLSQLGIGISLVNVDAIAARAKRSVRRATPSALILSSAAQQHVPRHAAPAAPSSGPILSGSWFWLGAFMALLWWWVHLMTHSGPYPTLFCPYFGYCD